MADIVLIDPPGTGYSRVVDEQRAHAFYGVDADAKALLQFVSTWSRTHHREHSPKFLLGESYGGLRAAVMARLAAGGPHETGRVETVAFNGIILIGPALMGRRASPDVRLAAALPSLAAAAHFHGRAGRGTSLTRHVAAARAFAEGPYLEGLFRGTRLSASEIGDLAGQLGGFIGLAAAFVKDHRLAVTPESFSREVLREEGRQVGQYDARYVLPLEPRGTDPTADDPAMGRYVPGFAASFEPYVREQFGVDRDGEAYRAQDYGAVTQRWRWDERDGGEDLAIALRRSQALELLAAVGHFDLVTTAGDVEYALTRHPMDPARWRMDLYTCA